MSIRRRWSRQRPMRRSGRRRPGRGRTTMSSVEFTPRQLEALDVIRCGGSTVDIEEELDVSHWRATALVRLLRERLGADTLADIPARADALGIPGGDCGGEQES